MSFLKYNNWSVKCITTRAKHEKLNFRFMYKIKS